MSGQVEHEARLAEIVAAAIAWRDAKDHSADDRLIDAVGALRGPPPPRRPADTSGHDTMSIPPAPEPTFAIRSWEEIDEQAALGRLRVIRAGDSAWVTMADGTPVLTVSVVPGRLALAPPDQLLRHAVFQAIHAIYSLQ